MKKSEKYLKGRIDKGIAQGSKNEYFILDRTAQAVINLYAEEQLDRAISLVRRQANINGIKGLCAKEDVVKLLKKMKDEKFELPRQFYPDYKW